VVPEGDLNYFRNLKQYIWDLYWIGTTLNKGPSLFGVMISPFPPRSEGASSEQPITSAWNPVNTKYLDLPSRTSNLEKVMVVPEPRESNISSPPKQSLPSPRPSFPLTNRTVVNETKPFDQSNFLNGSPHSTPVPSGFSNKNTLKPIQQGIISKRNENPSPHPSQYVHGPPGPPVNNSRTSWDKVLLREKSHAMVNFISRIST